MIRSYIDTPQNGLSSYAFAVKEIKAATEKDRQEVARHWAQEVKALAKMNTLDHHDHIVRFITAFRRGDPEEPEHYLIFEWADGGNLDDLWESTPKPQLTTSLVKAVIERLLGLAQALCAAHFLTDDGVYSGASYRHGDLKPANILRFLDGSAIGRLKIGDWGEAKNKQEVTAMRHSKTTSQYGTRRYEPPEVVTGVRAMLQGQEENRRSRLCDIWAMGCITLEFIVWLLYGVEGLHKLKQELKGELNDDPPFYQVSDKGLIKVARVHDVATHWMNYMARDPACEVGTTALGDLLEVVQTCLLVVKLPRKGGTMAFDNPQQPHTQPIFTQSFSQRTRDVPNESTYSEISIAHEDSPENGPVINVIPADSSEADMEPLPVLAGPERIRADEFLERLEHIIRSDEEESYWCTDSKSTVPKDVPKVPTADGPKKPAQKRINYGHGHTKFDLNDWSFGFDNKFASEVFPAFKDTQRFSVPDIRISSNLCDKCKDFRDGLWSPIFDIEYEVNKLEAKAKAGECDLCGLLWRTCERKSSTMFTKFRLERTDSSLKMNRGRLPVLSICRSPDLKSRKAIDLQIGFAELPEAGSPTHLELIRRWLANCDNRAPTCKPAKFGGQSSADAPVRLPTRLIDVGNVGENTVRLWETGPNDTGEWIALSHKWGPLPHFSTTCENRHNHVAGMDLEKLPATFKDAVIVTRALGQRYLWIDSICIVQGKGGDFQQEAKRMEEVYSGAYCVIAASCATGHYSGFLRKRNTRDHVALCRENESEAPFYVCQAIDNFKEHVLDGALNRRGWVLQEHALGRRTIFFTEHQTYWECGHGVRCETMTTLSNKSAELLGDPHFPQILDSEELGEKIARFQELYQIYSRLGLSNPYDRPTAIDGLQRRFLRKMHVQGGFGVFEGGENKGLLRRSLLWKRGADTPSLTRIEFPDGYAAVSSWSWMAYAGGKDANGKDCAGGIDYFKPKFGEFEWEDLVSPWSRSERSEQNNALTAKARQYKRRKGEGQIIIDAPAGLDQYEGMCVVLGIQKGSVLMDEKIHYVLVVVPTNKPDRNGSKVVERVGAGYLPGRCIIGDVVHVDIH